ncbi:hypothetical protein B9Z55_021481 [Caenorhabditis nigoni]|uniref:Uncharacterized protein n=1 Tax=Caenorhabditis nigoni TaxID=1611254 RepID=A0A2G5TSA8_9PELO|nr:hypothetical protein B9Z55_021481 [Caenorhabditis nigoni]
MHKVDWDQGLQKLLDQSDQTTLSKWCEDLKGITCVPVKSMDQKGIDELNQEKEQSIIHVYMYPFQTTVVCREFVWRSCDYTCFFGPVLNQSSLVDKTDCLDGFDYDWNGLCIKTSTQIASATTMNPNNNSNILPTPVVPKTQTNQSENPSTPSNPNPTLPGPKNPGNSNPRKSAIVSRNADATKRISGLRGSGWR